MGLERMGPILVIVLILLFCANNVFAAFGISPPYVKNQKLIPGSHYEQRIILSRSNPDENVQAKITLNIPEIENWFSVDPGFDFVLPQGESQFPMFIKVDVPKDAKFGTYKGYINVKVVPAKTEGGVAIALGAQIEVDLTVGEGGFADFLIRSMEIPDSLKKAWPIKYFNKIKVSISLENTGNVPVSPTLVHLDVYDITRKDLLESGDDTSFKKIEPFQTGATLAEFSTNLAVGEYFGHVKVFKGEELVQEWKEVFKVEKAAFSFIDWLIVTGVGIVLLIIIAATYWFYNLSKKKKPKKSIQKSTRRKARKSLPKTRKRARKPKNIVK